MGAVELFLLTVAAIFLVGVIGEIIFEKNQCARCDLAHFGWCDRRSRIGLGGKRSTKSGGAIFGALTLVIVLFDGGSRLNLEELIKVAPRSLSLAIVGFMLSIFTVALIAQVAFGLGLLPKSWTFVHGLMLGAIVGGASSVVIMPAMQKAGLPPSLSNIVNLGIGPH